MKYPRLSIILAALLVAGSAMAEVGSDADRGVATIITSGELPASCISAMRILNIDGKEISGGRQLITVTPGRHVIDGQALVNTSFCHKVGISHGGSRSKTPALEAAFEAGKTYYIGINHRASRQDNWYYEIWKVEDSK